MSARFGLGLLFLSTSQPACQCLPASLRLLASGVNLSVSEAPSMLTVTADCRRSRPWMQSSGRRPPLLIRCATCRWVHSFCFSPNTPALSAHISTWYFVGSGLLIFVGFWTLPARLARPPARVSRRPQAGRPHLAGVGGEGRGHRGEGGRGDGGGAGGDGGAVVETGDLPLLSLYSLSLSPPPPLSLSCCLKRPHS